MLGSQVLCFVAKQNVKACSFQMVIVTVWITSAVYSTPKFVFSKTIKNIHTQDGQEEEICVLDREMFNSKLLDMINFVLLYVMPLLVMTVSISYTYNIMKLNDSRMT